MSEDDWNHWYNVELQKLKKDLLNKLEIQPDDKITLQQLFKEVKYMRDQLPGSKL
jgi:hypothetical protein